MENTGQIRKGTQSCQKPRKKKSPNKQSLFRHIQLSQYFTWHLWTNGDIRILLKSVEYESLISQDKDSPYTFALKNLQSSLNRYKYAALKSRHEFLTIMLLFIQKASEEHSE